MELPPFASLYSTRPSHENYGPEDASSSYRISNLLCNSAPPTTPYQYGTIYDGEVVVSTTDRENAVHCYQPNVFLPYPVDPKPDESVHFEKVPVSAVFGPQDNEISSTTGSSGSNFGTSDMEDDLYFVGPRHQTPNDDESSNGKGKILWNGRGRRTLDPNKAGKTRRRIPNATQRTAANVRERKRMLHLNSAFDELRQCIPTFAYEKHLSRIDTLRLAMGYIRFMKDIIRSPTPEVYAKYANAAQEMKAKWSAKV